MTRVLLMTSQVAGLGDIFLASPVLKALRDGLPGSQVDLFTSASAREAAEAYAGWYRALHIHAEPSVREVLGRLRSARFDVVLCLSEALSSVLLARRIGGALTVGFDWDGRGLLLDRSVPYRKPEREHILDQYGDLARLVGVPGYVPMPFFPMKDAPPAGDHVVIHPGAGEAAKRWPAARYAEIARRLAEAGVPVVLVGGPQERPLSSLFPVHPRILNRIGELALRETAAVVAGARLFLGNDGGILHLASALGRPMVALYRSVNHGKAAPRCPLARVILAQRRGRPSSRIADIPLEQVWRTLVECLPEAP